VAVLVLLLGGAWASAVLNQGGGPVADLGAQIP
jgi:hypothetical protein